MESAYTQDTLAQNLLKADKIANNTNDYNLKRAIKEIKENSGTMYKDDVEKAGQKFEDDTISFSVNQDNNLPQFTDSLDNTFDNTQNQYTENDNINYNNYPYFRSIAFNPNDIYNTPQEEKSLIEKIINYLFGTNDEEQNNNIPYPNYSDQINNIFNSLTNYFSNTPKNDKNIQNNTHQNSQQTNEDVVFQKENSFVKLTDKPIQYATILDGGHYVLAKIDNINKTITAYDPNGMFMNSPLAKGITNKEDLMTKIFGVQKDKLKDYKLIDGNFWNENKQQDLDLNNKIFDITIKTDEQKNYNGEQSKDGICGAICLDWINQDIKEQKKHTDLKIENLQDHYNNVNKENYSTREKMMNIKLKAVMCENLNSSKLSANKQQNVNNENKDNLLKGNIGVNKTYHKDLSKANKMNIGFTNLTNTNTILNKNSIIKTKHTSMQI